MAKTKWSVLPEQASHGERLCIMLNGETVVAVTPSNTSIDRYMADYIVSAMILQETYGGGPEWRDECTCNDTDRGRKPSLAILYLQSFVRDWRMAEKANDCAAMSELSEEYGLWSAANGHPPMSADELLHELI